MEKNIKKTSKEIEVKIKDFSEKEIRKKIIDKVKPLKVGKRGAHNRRTIVLEGKKVGKVTLPNEHARIMKPSKSGYIAEQLKLSPKDFNDLIDCPLTGPKYYSGLAKKLE